MASSPTFEFILGRLSNLVLQTAADGDVEKLESLWCQDAIKPFSPSHWRAPARGNDMKPIYPDFPAVTDVAIIAAHKAHPRVLEWCFAKGFSPPRKSVMNEFYSAVLGSHSIPICQILYDHDFDFNAHHFDVGGNILAQAVKDGDVETARWLLEHGHSPNISGCGYSMSAICDAIAGENPSIECVKLLLHHGLVLTGMPGHGKGGMLAAAAVGNMEALALLLHYGADLEERDGFPYFDVEDKDIGCTPLWQACSNGQTEAVKFLLERGAYPRAATNVGVTCVEAAREGGHDEVVKLLEKETSE